MSLLRRGLERRSAAGAEWGNSDPPTNGQLGAPAAGTYISEQTALQLAAVYGSVRVLATSVASIPWQRFSSDDPATRRGLPLGRLLAKPYEEISRRDWLIQYVTSKALRGNFYGHIVERDENLFPTQIKPIHPDAASVRRIRSGPREGRPEYRFYGKTIPIDDVFHVRHISVAGMLTGLNPIEYLRLSLGLARAADLFGGSFFSNSALPLGAIEVADDLEDDEVLALAKSWKNAHQGLGQANLPAVLTNGAKFNAVSINPADAQFLESRQYSASEITGMMFGVPLHKVGLQERSTSWGTGLEQMETAFVRDTLIDYFSALEEPLTEILPRNERVKFKVSERMRGDKLARYQAHSLGILGGFLNADEAREEEDKAPLPDGLGETFLAPINTTTLAAAVQATLNPAQQPPPPTDPNTGGQPDGS